MHLKFDVDLEDDEQIVKESKIIYSKSILSNSFGTLFLTNKRLFAITAPAAVGSVGTMVAKARSKMVINVPLGSFTWRQPGKRLNKYKIVITGNAGNDYKFTLDGEGYDEWNSLLSQTGHSS